MFSKVLVNENALNYFRKLARQSFPLEIQAFIAGKVISIDQVEITDFLYTDNYAKQTIGEVCWYVDDYNKAKEKIEAKGYTILGEIHSHPNADTLMSPSDYNASVTQQFVISGICSVNKNKTKVRFWTPTSSLACRIIYK